jgi:hypothetical protein
VGPLNITLVERFGVLAKPQLFQPIGDPIRHGVPDYLKNSRVYQETADLLSAIQRPTDVQVVVSRMTAQGRSETLMLQRNNSFPSSKGRSGNLRA